MTPLALALVLGSAVLHAGWNLLAKRVAGGAPFVWLFAAGTALLYAPPALAYAVWARPQLHGAELALVAGSAAIHVGYFLSLQRGYRAGDLSLVYPLARGSGPLGATVLAVLLLGERPSALALAGGACVVGSAFVLAGGRGARAAPRALGYGLLTGAFIACYTVWDAYAVSRAGVHPLLFVWLSECARTLLLLPLVLPRWPEVRREWRLHRREALGVALLSPLAYALVLAALTFTPVSYVAPAREISILFGALLGAGVLAEGHARRRLGASLGMVLGVVLLALG